MFLSSRVVNSFVRLVKSTVCLLKLVVSKAGVIELPRHFIIISVILAYSIVLSFEPEVNYSVGTGDVLMINIWDENDLSGEYTVDNDGTIDFPLLGRIKVSGLQIFEIDRLITNMLAKDYLVNPQVTIEVKEYKSKYAYIQGEVQNPGVVILNKDSRLIDVIMKAGGLSPKSSNKLTLLRLNYDKNKNITYTQYIVDLVKLLNNADATQNIEIYPGDLIFIPASMSSTAFGVGTIGFGNKTITVVGEIKNPGVYPFQENLTVLNAVLNAGGFTKYANPNGTKLIRKSKDGGSEEYKVPMKDIIEKGKKDLDLYLQPDDMIIVPESLF